MTDVQRLAVAGATGLIGSQVVELARAAGHEVVPLSRASGADLTVPGSVGDRLEGVDAVIDTTRSPVMDQAGAVDFFARVAANLGAAAHATGVRRTVVLSIVGVDAARTTPGTSPRSPTSARPVSTRRGPGCCAPRSSTSSPGRCSTGAGTAARHR